MDSVRNLSHALPIRDFDAAEDLQPSFRAAALEITNLYRKASENGRRAYHSGYLAALQDLVEFISSSADRGASVDRVLDYIERRQEALRAGSESGDDVPTAASARRVDRPVQAGPTVSEARTFCAPESPVADFLQPSGPAQTTPPVPSSSIVVPTSCASPSSPSTEPAAPVPASLPTSFPFTFNPFDAAFTLPDVRTCASSSRSQRRRGGRGKDKARLASVERMFHAPPPPPTTVEVDPSGGGGYSHYVPVTLVPDANGKRRLDLSPSRHRRDRTADATMDEAEPEERSSKRLARTG